MKKHDEKEDTSLLGCLLLMLFMFTFLGAWFYFAILKLIG